MWLLIFAGIGLLIGGCRGDGDAANCIYQCQTVRIALQPDIARTPIGTTTARRN